MKHFSHPLRSAALVAVACAMALSAAPRALAQGKAGIQDIKFDNLPSPQVNVGKDKNFKPKDWLEVEAEVTIPAQSAEQKKAKFLNEVTVKWYVAVKNPEGKGYLLLSKELKHINVPVDEPVYTSVYMSPSTIKRMTGQDRAGKSAVDLVGLEVLVNGQKVGAATNKGKEGWWESTSANLSRSEQFPLLTKDETPFAMLWFDRYAELQKQK